MQALCLDQHPLDCMARLSIGSQHFQARSKRSALLTDKAERVLSAHSEVTDHELQDYASDHASELNSTSLKITHTQSLQTQDNYVNSLPEDSPKQSDGLRGQVTLLTVLNKDLKEKNIKLQKENTSLRNSIEDLRSEYEFLKRTEALDELESTIVSSFAKVLEGAQLLKLQRNLSKLASAQDGAAQDEFNHQQTIPLLDTSQSQTIANFGENPRKPQSPAKVKDDYLKLTFFKPTERKTLPRRLTGAKSAQLSRLPRRTRVNESSAPFLTSSLQKHQPHDPVNVLSALVGEEVLDTKEIRGSTPNTKSKKRIITDIYGDEIDISKKIDSFNKKFTARVELEFERTNSSKAEAWSGSEKKKGIRHGRKALSNVTNSKANTGSSKLQLIVPVDLGFFDFVDENVLMEQTQNSLKAVKNRFRENSPQP